LKAIHHFASCYYRERGQLFDSSRDYRGMKKERRRQRQENIHTLATNTIKHETIDSETEHTETENETTEEDEDENDDMDMDAVDTGKDGPRTKGDTYRKDMYKALDGSALMAIGPSINFDSEVGSTCFRYCAAGVCSTYTPIETSCFRGTWKPQTEKNRTVIVLGWPAYKDNRMQIYDDANDHYFDGDDGADSLFLGSSFKMYLSVKVPSSHRFRILFR
jgi:hypothetical protein